MGHGLDRKQTAAADAEVASRLVASVAASGPVAPARQAGSGRIYLPGDSSVAVGTFRRSASLGDPQISARPERRGAGLHRIGGQGEIDELPGLVEPPPPPFAPPPP